MYKIHSYNTPIYKYLSYSIIYLTHIISMTTNRNKNAYIYIAKSNMNIITINIHNCGYCNKVGA